MGSAGCWVHASRALEEKTQKKGEEIYSAQSFLSRRAWDLGRREKTGETNGVGGTGWGVVWLTAISYSRETISGFRLGSDGQHLSSATGLRAHFQVLTVAEGPLRCWRLSSERLQMQQTARREKSRVRTASRLRAPPPLSPALSLAAPTSSPPSASLWEPTYTNPA